MTMPDQLAFQFAITPAVVERRPEGILVRPGRPITQLTTAAFAAQFGVTADAVLRWINAGLVPAELVRRGGLRKYLIEAEAVAYCRAQFDRRSAGQPWLPLAVWRRETQPPAGSLAAPSRR